MTVCHSQWELTNNYVHHERHAHCYTRTLRHTTEGYQRPAVTYGTPHRAVSLQPPSLGFKLMHLVGQLSTPAEISAPLTFWSLAWYSGPITSRVGSYRHQLSAATTDVGKVTCCHKQLWLSTVNCCCMLYPHTREHTRAHTQCSTAAINMPRS